MTTKSHKPHIMHIISRKRLNEFAEVHLDAKPAPVRWYRLARNRDFSDFVNLRQTFPAADQVGKLTVFNIGGKKVRLITAYTIIAEEFMCAPCSLTPNMTSNGGGTE